MIISFILIYTILTMKLFFKLSNIFVYMLFLYLTIFCIHRDQFPLKYLHKYLHTFQYSRLRLESRSAVISSKITNTLGKLPSSFCLSSASSVLEHVLLPAMSVWIVSSFDAQLLYWNTCFLYTWRVLLPFSSFQV